MAREGRLFILANWRDPRRSAPTLSKYPAHRHHHDQVPRDRRRLESGQSARIIKRIVEESVLLTQH